MSKQRRSRKGDDADVAKKRNRSKQVHSRISQGAKNVALDLTKLLGMAASTITAYVCSSRLMGTAWRAAHRPHCWDDITSALNDDEFQIRFRLTRSEFSDLLQRITAQVPSFAGKRRSRLSAELRLASALRYLAGGSQLDIVDLYGQRTAAFYHDFWETIDAIHETEKLGVDWTDKSDLEALARTCAKGRAEGIYDNVVGYIDGIVFKTHRPGACDVRNVKDMYVARKSTYGINAQVICDGDLRITFFACTVGSSSHDSRAFKETALGQLCEDGKLPGQFMFAGDAAYSGNRRVLTPYGGTWTKGTPEDTFNFIHSSHRVTVERCFGVLVRRWGILWRPLTFSTLKNLRILEVLCRLHNICMLRRTDYHKMDCRRHELDCGTQPSSNEEVFEDHCYAVEHKQPGDSVAEVEHRKWITCRLAAQGFCRP